MNATSSELRALTGAALMVLAAALASGCNRNESPSDVQRNVAKEQSENGAEMLKRQAEADYDAARQKCDATGGPDKDPCLQRAKAERDQRMAAAEARSNNRQD